MRLTEVRVPISAVLPERETIVKGYKRQFAFVLAVLVTALYVGGCSSAQNVATNTVLTNDTTTEAVTSILPDDTTELSTSTVPKVELTGAAMDYFPHQVGMTWTWEIRQETALPLQDWTTMWPQANKGVQFRKGIIIPSFDTAYTLTLKVAHLADDIQTGEDTLSGVELQIVRDDLNIYQDAERLFWAFVPGNDSLVVEIAYLPGSFAASSGYPDSAVTSSQGISMRPIFFDGDVAISSDYTYSWNPLEADDVLYFGSSADDSWTFVREVAAEKNLLNEVLKRAFTETVTYDQGVGMISLHQEIAGLASMSWELVDFNF